MKKMIEKSDVKKILRNELPVLRAKIGISQETLAERIGISRQTYSAIETGKREMTWTTALALVAFFQNNEKTRPMIDRIEGLSSGLSRIMSISDDESR